MDLRRITYFTRIAELGNMTRAAESLGVAQPALSQQIAGLEQDLGTRLFSRSTGGMRLTSAGEVFYRHATALLRQMDHAVASVRDDALRPTGRVALGLPGSTSKILAIDLLERLRAHPGITLEIVERPSAELPALVLNGRLDMAIAVDATQLRGVHVAPLILEELCVFTAETLAPRDHISLAEIAAQPLVLPSLPSTIRQRVDAAFLEARLRLSLLAEISSTDLLVRVVGAGLGWTILPRSAGGELIEEGRLKAYPIADHPLSREIALCLPEIAPLSHAAQTVRDLLLACVEDAVRDTRWAGARHLGLGRLERDGPKGDMACDHGL